MMSLPVWLTGLMFLLGVSVSGPMFLPGGVFVQGFFVQVGLCPWETPPYGDERAVRILLEFFLVFNIFLLQIEFAP